MPADRLYKFTLTAAKRGTHKRGDVVTLPVDSPLAKAYLNDPAWTHTQVFGDRTPPTPAPGPVEHRATARGILDRLVLALTRAGDELADVPVEVRDAFANAWLDEQDRLFDLFERLIPSRELGERREARRDADEAPPGDVEPRGGPGVDMDGDGDVDADDAALAAAGAPVPPAADPAPDAGGVEPPPSPAPDAGSPAAPPAPGASARSGFVETPALLELRKACVDPDAPGMTKARLLELAALAGVSVPKGAERKSKPDLVDLLIDLTTPPTLEGDG